MRPVIYIDVLLAVNLFINYFLLLATAKFLGIPHRKWRLALGAMAGAAASLQILLPSFPVPLELLEKLALSALLVWAALPLRGVRMFLKAMGCFYVMNFAFAGFVLAVWYFFSPPGLVIKNSVVYLAVSPILLIGTTVACYVLLRLVFRLIGKPEVRSTLCTLSLTVQGETVSCTARIDTGNSLVEPFSQFPVAVVEYDVLRPVLSEEWKAALCAPLGEGAPDLPIHAGIRMVPFHSVGGEGVLPAFRPQACVIDCDGKRQSPSHVYVAVSSRALGAGEFSALLNPALLSGEAVPCETSGK